MFDNYSMGERVGIFTALSGVLSGIFIWSLRLLRLHSRVISEHNQMLQSIREANAFIPRYLATEEAVEYLKRTQEQQLEELRGLRSDLTLLMTRLINSLGN